MDVQEDNFEETMARMVKIRNWIEQLIRENTEKDFKIKELESRLANR